MIHHCTTIGVYPDPLPLLPKCNDVTLAQSLCHLAWQPSTGTVYKLIVALYMNDPRHRLDIGHFTCGVRGQMSEHPGSIYSHLVMNTTRRYVATYAYSLKSIQSYII